MAGAPLADAALSDEAWYRKVHRAHERQFTLRAVVSGCVIGSVLSAANLYTGLVIGYTFGASITAAIAGWMVFRVWSAATRSERFTVLENNTMQTAASAAGAMAGAGMVNVIPALMQMTGRRLSALEIAAWLIPVAFLGVCFAVPLKRQLVDKENLRFPSGIAAAETTLALHGEGLGAATKAKALFGAGLLGALLNFVRGGLELIPESLPKVGPAVGGHSFAKLTLQGDMNLLSVGAGALIGLRTTAWMAVGATICWGGLVPWVVNRGYVAVPPSAPSYFSRAVKWCMWPGVTMLVVASLVSFAFRARSIVQAFRGLKTLKRDLSIHGSAGDVEVPMRWVLWGLAVAAPMVVAVQHRVFHMHPAQTVLAMVLSALLALVGTRVMGETDVNPIGAMGKVTQLLFAVVAPGNPQANLTAAGVTSAAANGCGDMMQDLKTGRVLGASPRWQFPAQLVGVVTGGVVTVVVFLKAFPLDLIGTKYPAPAVQTWKAMAELLTKGIANLPPYTPHAMGVAAALATIFSLMGELGSPRVKRWVPSATGLGLSFILPASNTFTFLVGAVLAELVGWRWPKRAESSTIAVASGLIAGESVMGVAVALYTAMHLAK